MLSPAFLRVSSFLITAGVFSSTLLPLSLIYFRYLPKSFLFSKRMKLLSILLKLRSSFVMKLYLITFISYLHSLFPMFNLQACNYFMDELMLRFLIYAVLFTFMMDLLTLFEISLFNDLMSILLIILRLSDISVYSSILNQML